MPENLPLYSLTEAQVLNKLSSRKTGLSFSEAEERLTEFGPNQITQKKKVSPFSIYFSQFKNSLILILLGAAFLVFVVWFFERDNSDLIEGSLIVAIIFLITILGFFQEYKAEKAVEALKKLLAFKAKVIREGHEREIDVSKLVPGDIVILEEGEKVPADIRLLEVASLSVIEASLTGESTPVGKSVEKLTGSVEVADQKNLVFAGTVIAVGRGLGVVVRTGDGTEIGKIARDVSSVVEEQTPIQKRLDQIGKVLGYVVLAIAAVVFVFIVLFASGQASSLLERIVQSFIAAIALAVAAIPEGLPAVVTISLALGTQRMLKRNALVRKLSSVETLGSVDVICADKTGTLTRGEMTVREIYFDGNDYQVSGVGYETSGEFTDNGKKVDPENLKLLLTIGQACNNAVFEKGHLLGDPTEGALLVSATKAGVNTKCERVKEIPFSSERKMMSVVVKENSKFTVYTKGAPEIVLDHCSKILKGGKEVALTASLRKEIEDQVEVMSGKALRTLGFAFRTVAAAVDDPEKELVFVGLQGMIDPPRPEVIPLITQCKESGIRVIMLTGDHLATAKAVAAEIGIEGEALAGSELEKFSEEELFQMVKKVNIYARITPNTKLKVVESLKKHGSIVAMTGDGVNDAPAVKKADVGLAMGITGTDVAKEASDIILLDDNFSTIVSAIEEGRGIFENIRKFVNYLLSCNIGEVIVVFLAVILFKDLPLTATMLLWINVVTDGLPAVALGADPAEKGIMKYSPKRFQKQIIDRQLWVEMVIFGILLTVGVLGLYYHNLPEGLEEARASAFIAIIIFELVRLVIIRADHNTPFFSNRWLVAAVGISLLLQVAIVYTPPLANLFAVKHIDFFDWGYILLGSLVLWIAFEISRRLLDFVPFFRGD